MSLAEKLRAQIAQNGPMRIDEFMAACLYDPVYGYYATRPALGGDNSDFITAPEGSQMFGELMGLWCAHEWTQIGQPAPFDLIELGPGRGVLMEDARRASLIVREFYDAARVHFVETSGPLRLEQAKRVPGATWHARIEDVPHGPSLIIANEFLDCLPIRQFVRQRGEWRERLLGLHGDSLAFGLSGAIAAPAGAPDRDDIWEIAPGLAAFIDIVAARLKAAPGRALFIDYGGNGFGDTLQAMQVHRHLDPLACPGEADLTAHVDFSAAARLAEAAGLAVHGSIGQGAFLRALGVEERAQALASARPDRADRIWRELDRLTSRDQMGVLFQAICLSSPNLPPPAGF